MTAMDAWVRDEYRSRYCDKNGRLIDKVNIDKLFSALNKLRPNEGKTINDALKRYCALIRSLCYQLNSC